MELSKCLGCMDDLQTYPCPHCGYDPAKEPRPEYALPRETILAGKYLVGRVLGQGGFGITYIGWDIALERKVAIKEYYPSGQVSRSPGNRSLTWYTNEPAVQAREDGMKMFLKEARKMVKADSIPGVVRVLDLFQENDTAYIVMDFVSGETLKTRLQKTGPMTWTQAAPIFRPAIRAMEQVHQAGLIHRDLSPDNLMLTPNGDVKILDLGAAKDLNLNSGASSMQVAKSGFSPWEQYTQRGGSGPWTDVYAMAATIYFAITGKLPPVAIDRVDEDTISWGEAGLDTLPETALEALKKAMAVSTKNRTQSMEELEAGLFGNGPKTEPPPVPTPAPMRPGKMVYVAIAAAVVLVVVSLETIRSGVSTEPKATLSERGSEFYETADEAPEIESIETNNTEAKQEDHWADLKESEETNNEAEYPEGPSRAGDRPGTAESARSMQPISSIAAGSYHTVGLHTNGSVVAVGSNTYGACDVGGWSDIAAIAAGNWHTVGLHSDGSVVAVGKNEYGECDINSWHNISAVAAGCWHTVGLHSDGSVVATGSKTDGQCNVSGWSDIVAVAAGDCHTVGLRSNGTVVAVGSNEYGQCNVSNWSNIVAISAGSDHTVGLRSDGSVVTVGNNEYDQCNVSDWSDIVAIAAGGWHTVGLRSDGSAVAVGNGRCDISDWSDIVAIAAGWNYTIGLHDDGSVVAVGANAFGQCDVTTWTDIQTPSR